MIDDDHLPTQLRLDLKYRKLEQERRLQINKENYLKLESKNKSDANSNLMVTPKLQKFVMQTSAKLMMHSNVVICSALSKLSLASQGLYNLQLEDHHCPIPLSLWFLVEMASGSGKSEISDYLDRLTETINSDLRSGYENACKTYEGEVSVWTNVTSGLESALKKKVKRGEPIEKTARELAQHIANAPSKPKDLANNLADITKSGMCSTALHSLASLGIHCPEGGVVLNNIDPAFMYVANSFWRGEEFDYRRMNQVSSKLKDVTLTIMLYAQPGVIEKFLDRHGESAWDCGFLSRFLICRSGVDGFGEGRVPPAFEVSADDEGEQYFSSVIRRMMIGKINDNWTGFNAIKSLRLNSAARLRFEELKAYVAAEQAARGRFERIGPFCRKLPEIVGRMAGLMHLYETGCEGDGIVSREAMENAIDLGLGFAGIYINYFRDRFGYSEIEKDEHLLWKWLCVKILKEGYPEIYLRSILQYGPAQIRTKARRDRALQTLIDREWVRIEGSFCNKGEVVKMTSRGETNMEA